MEIMMFLGMAVLSSVIILPYALYMASENDVKIAEMEREDEA